MNVYVTFYTKVILMHRSENIVELSLLDVDTAAKMGQGCSGAGAPRRGLRLITQSQSRCVPIYTSLEKKNSCPTATLIYRDYRWHTVEWK